MAAQSNLIQRDDLARVREVEFVSIFSENLTKLTEALGITRKIPKQAGAVLKIYKAAGELESGTVAEGELIPLSKYQTQSLPYKELTLKKWRKATSAEAILDRGYDQAVAMTTDRMLLDVQKEIRRSFFDFLATGTGRAAGATFQAALAQCWGQLQVLFEDDALRAVYFLNPLDVADYLAAANVSTQTAFGMTYLENFLGLGRVFLNTHVPRGRVYATAQDNLVLYYIPVGGGGLGEAFSFTSDATGYIGIHETPDYDNMTAKDTVTCGVELFAERLDGVVVGTIGAEAGTLGSLTVTSAAGTASGDTKLTVSPAKAEGHLYKVKVGEGAAAVAWGQSVQGWTAWDGAADLTAATGKTVTVVECGSDYKALAAGSAVVTAKA